MIEISESAAREIRRLQENSEKPESVLYLSVEKGGCSGLYYKMEIGTRLAEGLVECDNIPIMIDPESHSLIRGLKLDYSEDLMGGGFLFNNPNASHTCSCGQSFAIN